MKTGYIILIMFVILFMISVWPVFATFCYNEFSSDLIWIYVASSINGKNSSTSSGYTYIDSGLYISSCIPSPFPIKGLRTEVFNDTFRFSFFAEVGRNYTIIFPPPAGNYVGIGVIQNTCTGDTPESHIGCVAFLSGTCGV